MKKINKVIAVVMAVFLAVTCVPLQAVFAQETYSFTMEADPDTYNMYPETSTLNDGRVWRNKDVTPTNFSYYLKNNDPDGDLVANQNEFLVALSALGQSFPFDSVSSEIKAANVVMVMDMSTSMAKNPLSDTDPTVRTDLMKSVAKQFVATLCDIADQHGNPIRVSLVSYAGYGVINLGWTMLNSSTKGTVNSAISALKTGIGSNTNAQAGLYLANVLYDETHAPENVDSELTHNFVLFMSDGAPNRCYINDDTIPMNAAGTQTTEASNITRTIKNTDYRYDAAVKNLTETNKLRQVTGRNMTIYSLGLGSWFTTDSEDSGFPTAPNLLKLVAAVGNGVLTIDEALAYLGDDVPDGCMPGSNPTYPVITTSKFVEGSVYRIYHTSGSLSFATAAGMMQAMETDSHWNTGDLTQRQSDGVYSIPSSISARIRNYYAGNTVETFTQSFQNIAAAIISSLDNYIPNSPRINLYIEESGESKSFLKKNQEKLLTFYARCGIIRLYIIKEKRCCLCHLTKMYR